MKKTRKTFKGTVLFTTVSVMALLILFLMGTLMLATASNGRAHKSYSSSQASYTARAAIDGFVTAMERQPEVAIAVQQLEGSGSAIYPTVTIGSGGSSSLGRVVRYDDTGAEHLDEIVVENTGRKSFTFYDNKATGKTGAAWHESEVVKITATARVGNEIESVTAYINKVPSDYSETTAPGPQVKGLQVVGGTATNNGGYIFGGFGACLDSKSTELKDYIYENKANYETSLTFINANFASKTDTFHIHVYEPDNLTTPYSETIISGSYVHHNKSAISLNYAAKGNWTNKEIPYMYINGAFVEYSRTDSGNPFIDDETGGDSAFNLFCGTLRTEDNYGNKVSAAFESTNLYMMDEYDPDPAKKYYFPGEIKAAGITRGDNLWGADNTSSGKLSQWSNSLFDKTDMYASDSHGGNVYCNGRLTIGGVTIDGDVRVRENFIVEGNNKVIINGDLIVGGTISDSNNMLTVRGNIYNGAGSVGEYKHIPYQPLPNEAMPESGSANTKYDFLKEISMDDPKFQVQLMKWDTDLHLNGEGLKVDPMGNPYGEEVAGVVYYGLVPDVQYSTEFAYEIDKLNLQLQVKASPEELAFGENSLFAKYLDKFDTSVYITEEDALSDPFLNNGTNSVYYLGKPVNVGTSEEPQFIPSVSERATEAKYFFCPEDNRVMTQAEVDEAKAQLAAEPVLSASSYRVVHPDTGEVVEENVPYPIAYWFEWGGEKKYKFTEEEVPYDISAASAGATLPLSLSGLTVEEIYPIEMRREYIYGIEQIKASTVGGDPDMYMLAADGREDLRFIKNIFEAREALGLDRATGLPKTGSYMNDDELDEVINNAMAGVANPNYSGGKVINQKFCRLTGTIGNPSETITVKGSDENDGTVVLLLDGTGTSTGCHVNSSIRFERTSPDQKLIIIFKGDVIKEKGMIAPTVIPDVIKYTDDYGITYMGYENSSFNLYNGAVAFGSFKCPGTSFICKTNEYRFKYIGETNPTATEHIGNIVGNAIFKQAETNNDFALLYTQAGNTPNSPGGGKAINTACGKFVVGYYGAS